MANPVLTKALNTRPQGYAQPGYGAPQGYAQPGYQQPGYPQAGYPEPAGNGFGPQGYVQDPNGQYVPYGGQQAPGFDRLPASEGRMTLDDVVTKTAITIGIVVLVASAVFALLPIPLALGAWLVGGLGAFIFTIVTAFRARVGAASALIYAALEGLFVGGITKMFEAMYPGIAVQAVLGTFVAAGVVLASVKMFKIRPSEKFRRMLFVATIAYAIGAALSFLLSLVGVNMGLGSLGSVTALGLIFTLIGTVLAVFNLVQDFADVQTAIESGAPASESWRAAYGITVTMVWLYVNILRLLSYMRD